MTTLPRISPEVSWTSYWPIWIGLLSLFVPTYATLSGSLWTQETSAHGPIILVVAIWLTWMNREHLVDTGQQRNPVLGAIAMLLGLLLYVVGRSQQIYFFEVGSEIPILAGVLLITFGYSVTRKFWFPLVFLFFLVPLPGSIVDALSNPLKQQVSFLVENILYAFDYPIARSGVMLSIGQYQLLVADACSGLNSIFSLSALGLFYAYLVKRQGWVHNAILVASIVPIAFTANVVRVILLVLITYYYGDEAGQGFAHNLTGLVLFVSALTSYLLLDGFIQMVRIRLASKPS